MATILITGCNGQVGFELQRSMAPLGDLVCTTSSSLDLKDTNRLDAALSILKPSIIINPAAYTAVDKAESDQATALTVNVTAVKILANWAQKNNALLVHYSTDYVFAGEGQRPHHEEDKTNPQSVYGQTKWAGEEAIRSSGCRHLIFRTSWVYGAHGNNFLKTMLKLMSTRDSLRVINDQFGAPTGASLLADITAQVLAQYLQFGESTFAFGTYHLAARGETSWYGYAQEICKITKALGVQLQCDLSAIEPIPTEAYPLPAPRPRNSRLSTEKFQRAFNLRLPPWQDGVKQVITLLNSGS